MRPDLPPPEGHRSFPLPTSSGRVGSHDHLRGYLRSNFQQLTGGAGGRSKGVVSDGNPLGPLSD
jgi:hypothetical protein